MQQAAPASGKGDTTPAPQDVYEFESLGQPERSKSLSSKRGTTPLARASPVQGESRCSVAFRPPSLMLKITLKDRPCKRSEPDGHDPMRKASAKTASQESSPGPGLVPSSNVNKTGSGLRDVHGLAPDSLRTTNSREKTAAEVLTKSGSPALGPASKKSKRTVNSKKTHESPRLTSSVTTDGPEKPRDAPLSAVEERTADLNLSAAVQNNTSVQARGTPSPLVHQQKPKDEQAVLDHPSKGAPDLRMVETVNIGDPISKAAGPKVSRSASCTEIDPSQSTGEASIPSRNRKSTVEDETSSPRLDEERVASAPHALPSQEDIKDRSAILSGVGVGTTTVAAAAAEQALGNTEGTEPAIHLLNTTSEPHMEQCMRRHLKESHDNHEYFIKV